MKEVSAGEFKKLTKDDIVAALPLGVTYEGKAEYIVVKPEDVIVVSDLHPYVRATLKAQEGRIRAGMPKAEKLTPKGA